MALSDKKRISNDRWIKDNYRQVKLSMPKSEAELLDWYCTTYDLSKAGFIREAIKEKMARDASIRPTDGYLNLDETAEVDTVAQEEPGKVVQVIIRPRQSEADTIKKSAAKACQSIQAYIMQAIEERMRRESDADE